MMLLDWLVAAGVIITLNLVQKYNWAWIVYAFVSILFALVMLYHGLIGQWVLGIFLTITGFKNFIKGLK